MDSEIPPSSFGQNQGEPELPRLEAILALLQAEIQALKQVEMVSIQFFQVLERQMMEAETLVSRVKKRRDIPKSRKKASKEQYWWGGLAGDIKFFGEQCESYGALLESIEEKCKERFQDFQQLQEDIDNRYPQ